MNNAIFTINIHNIELIQNTSRIGRWHELDKQKKQKNRLYECKVAPR